MTDDSWFQKAEGQPAFLADGQGRLRLLENGECDGDESLSFAGLLADVGASRPLVVAGSHFPAYRAKAWLDEAVGQYELFDGFSANPTYDQVVSAAGRYRSSGCDSLVSVGGGSAIDVAKCVQAFCGMPGDGEGSSFCEADLPELLPPHVALPTTAGTGSESTHFAVIYVDGVKHSVTDHRMLPTAAVLDPATLAGLPGYQRSATMMDALCQAIESFWSMRSCEQSRAHSARAIPAIVGNASAYLAGDANVAAAMMVAANEAGRAINLTTTTAPHAMSYKLTSLYGIAHGHAVALCMPGCWRFLIERAEGKTVERLREISQLIAGSDRMEDGLAVFEELLVAQRLGNRPAISEADLAQLVSSVNEQRLANFPQALAPCDIERIYRAI